MNKWFNMAHTDESDLVSENSSETENRENIDIEPAETKKKSKTAVYVKIVISLIIILAVIGAAGYFYYRSLRYVTTDDAFITGRPVYITPHLSDYVLGVYVINDQHVNEGDLLVDIDPRNYQARLNQAKADVAVAEAKLEAAVAYYKIAIDAQNTAAIDMSRDQILMAGTTDGAAISQERFEHSISAYYASVSQVSLAKAGVLLARAEIDKAKAALNQSEITLSYTKIYAPCSGYVTKRNIEVGSFVNDGVPVMSIVSDIKWVVANLKETQLEHVKIGQDVDIYIDAYPNAVFKGKVNGIQAGTGEVFTLFPPENATGNFIKVVQRVPVEIVFDEMPEQNRHFIALGMSVVPYIKVK